MTKINILENPHICILLILLIIILIIYGYLFNIKNKQVQYIVESFNNELSDIKKDYSLVSLTSDIKDLLKESSIPINRMPNYANGTWLTNKSKIQNNVVVNTMKINITESGGQINYINQILNVKTIENGSIITEEGYDGTYLLLSFIPFTNKNNLNLPYEAIAGLPRCLIYVLNKINNINDKFISLKLLNGIGVNDINPELKRIINYKIFSNEIPYLDYDIFSYRKIIGNYKFAKNTIISHEYGIPMNNNKKETLDYQYPDGLAMCLKRIYKTANNKLVTTRMSQKFFVKPYQGSNSLSSIQLLDPYTEMNFNNISEKFKPDHVTVYYYRYVSSDIKYNFAQPNRIDSNSFWGSTNGLQNNMENQSNLSHNELSTLEKVTNSKYNIVTLGTFFYNNKNNTMNVQF